MKNRVFFILWIAVLAILWLIGRLQAAEVLLIDTVLAVVILAAYAFFFARRIKTDFELKGSYDGTKQASLKINTDYRGWLPIRLSMRLQMENCLTGEKGKMTLEGLHSRNESDMQFDLQSSHAGKLQVEIETAYITDLFGIFRFRLKEAQAQKLTCLLLPQAVPPQQLPEILSGYEQSSDVYAEDRPGMDQSSTYELRDYRSGDNIRAIHWKLSSRNENWIVRDGSYPIGYRLLLLIENSYARKKNEDIQKAAIEHACAAMIALSEELTDRGIIHHIGWWDKQTQSIKTVEIQSAEDLMRSLGAILGATLEERKKTIWERFLENSNQDQFSQIIVIDDETAKNYSL